jgi:hypothetical protein
VKPLLDPQAPRNFSYEFCVIRISFDSRNMSCPCLNRTKAEVSSVCPDI